MTSSYCICPPKLIGDTLYTDYNQFMGSVFGECLYVYEDWIPAAFGLLSIFTWMCALMPQLIVNYRRKECESLSPFFVFIWWAGDLSTLVGAILLGSRTTAIGLGIYFVCNGVVLCGQVYYYNYVHTKRLPETANTGAQDRAGAASSSTTTPAFAVLLLASGALAGLWHTTSGLSNDGSVGRSLLGVDEVNLCNASADLSLLRYCFGALVAWISGMLYFCSRLPQVYHNYQHKKCEGLSITMFLLAIFANATFAFQFISGNIINSSRGQAMDWGDFACTELPFVLGSLGTLVYDFIIVYQWRFYSTSA